MKKTRAFTLIELLVVIAIIAVLLSVLIPALTRIKDAGKRAVCLYNHHSLGTAWVLYSEQNESNLPNGMTARIREIAPVGNIRKFIMVLDPASQYFYEATWVGWPEDNNLLTDPKAQEACIMLGCLYPLVETMKLYRCPVGLKDQYRTYSIPDSMHGYPGFESVGGTVIRKMSELRNPGSRMAFIDEGVASTESWTMYPNLVKWWDKPPLRHGQGTTVAMADGSSVYWKYRDKKTFEYIEDLNVSDAEAFTYAQDNEDFTKLQIAIWGKAAKP